MFRFIIILCIILASCELQAQIILIKPNDKNINNVVQESPKPLVKDFEEALKQYSNWVNNVSNEDVYKSLKMKDRSTGEVVEFEKLSDLKKDLFYLWQSEICSNKMSSLESKWFDSYNKNKSVDESDEKDPNRVANKKDIIKYGTSLRELREKHAKNYEKLIKEIFKKHSESIPKKDQEAYLKRIQDWNTKENLIKEEDR